MEVTIYPQNIDINAWAVECITNDSDGSVEKAVFYGTKAEQQAIRYAKSEYPDIAIDQLSNLPVPQKG